ncbi:MAG: OadG family transporter subunit [Puniceicoccaceae bacterium]
MHFPTQFILAAAEPPDPTNVLATGFLFVVLVLCLLFLITFLAGRVFAARNAAAAPAEEKRPPRAAELQAHRQEEENRVAAVVTAAIHVALQDRKFRVRSIRPTSPGWAQEGRRQIFSSHRLR